MTKYKLHAEAVTFSISYLNHLHEVQKKTILQQLLPPLILILTS